MKPLLFILLSILCLSCTKDNSSIEKQLSGKWELRKYVGGWTGTINFPPGNGNTWEFTRTNYSHYINGQPDESGSYTIIKDSIWGNIADRIIYNGVIGYPKSFIRIDNNQLSFYSNIIDAGGSLYEKIK